MMAIPQSVNESKDNCTRVGPRGRHEGGMMAITQRYPSGWWTVGRHEGEVIAIPVSVTRPQGRWYTHWRTATQREQQTRRSACTGGR